MTIAQKLIIELIRYEISGIDVSKELISSIDENILEEVYEISISQDVSYIIASALIKLNLLNEEVKAVFFNEQLAGIYCYERFRHELESVCNLFEENHIKHIPLKGSVIRNYYPKPEMRTSCDTDILIHEEDLDKARNLLCSELNYRFEHNGSHDIAFMSESGAGLELHFRLSEDKNEVNKILEKVWDYCFPCDDYTYKFQMQPEFFMFYHIFHMAKHFRSGGCGIRPFMDLYVLKGNFPYDDTKLHSLLDGAGLSKFADTVFQTAFTWFGNRKYDETVELIEEYIFSAGIYGTFENMVAMSVAKRGSKTMDMLGRIFLPYRLLKYQFPILDKYPLLTPFYEIKRWFRILFKDKSRVQFKIAKQNLTLSDEKRKKAIKLVESLGIKRF